MANKIEIVITGRNELPAALEAAKADAGAAGTALGKETGEKAGQAAAEGMSPLLVGAIGGAAALGAPVLLAGLGTAFVGITALALKSNATIAADYTQLGKTAGAAITQAAAPLAGDMHQAVTGLEGDLKTLQPQLNGLFANVGPDIAAVSSGIGAFTTQALPGLSSALGSSQVIVKDVAGSMGGLGSSVGSFFTGLTTDAATTGAGLSSVLGVAGNAISTLGSVVGSASSAMSADLLAVDPVINTLLTSVKDLANPATVGGVAGLFAAMKFGGESGALTNGLTAASKGLAGFAKDAAETTGVMGSVKGLAGGMGTAFGKAAEVMSGPWGLAVGAGVGLLSGLAGELYTSMHASDALTLSQQSLADAISKDSGQAGANTAALVAQAAAADGLSATAQAAGVSTSTWTQAVLGNKDAQAQVIASVNTYNRVLDNQKVTTDENAKSTGKFSDEQRGATVVADENAAATNQLTDKNKQLLASMNAQTKQVADAIAKQTDYQKAMAAVTSTQALFNATLTAGHNSLTANAQATSMNTIAALNLGTNSYDLNQQLYNSVDAYNQAQAEGNAYLQVLDSMSGTINGLLGAEAAFTTSIANLDKQVDKSGASLDVNTAAGAKNITALTQIANAADKTAGAVYDNEVSTKGATQAFNDANAKLAQEKQAFIQAADKAGLNKDAVKALADELFKLPPDVKVGADINPALNSLNQLINTVNTSSGTISVILSNGGTSLGNPKGSTASYAKGGVVGAAVGGARDGWILTGEHGPELMRLPVPGATVMPNANTMSMLAGAGGESGGRTGGGGTFELHVAPGGDSAVATMINQLSRLGLLQIKKKAIVG